MCNVYDGLIYAEGRYSNNINRHADDGFNNAFTKRSNRPQ
jgi:hypothetical protein